MIAVTSFGSVRDAARLPSVRMMQRPAAQQAPGREPLPPSPDPYVLRRREAVYRWAASRCGTARRSRVLDLGCGDGFGSAILAGAGLDVLGIDPDPRAVMAATRSWRSGRIAFRCASLRDTREGQHTWDAVVCTWRLERLPDPRPLLREALRVLVPGGLFIVCTPNRLVASPGRTRPISGEHAWEYTGDELHRLVAWRFGEAHIHSLVQGLRLRWVQSALGESLPVTLARLRPPDRAAWLRLALQGLRASDFHVETGCSRQALDLVAIATA